MARILINHYRNIAIECSRKDKWSVLVIGWAPVRRIKVLNSEVDKDWKTFDYDLNSAIDRMVNSTIEDTALKELNTLREKICTPS
jgi:hypothetical protein